jgi:F420H(2)-dependent quinone reductase
MSNSPFSHESLRAMYQGGRANPAARRLARFWAVVFKLGLMPRRWVTLEVTGRRSGRLVRFPLGMANWGGQWYLVSFPGENCDWVRNVQAAGGQVTLRHRRAMRCRLTEVPVSERAPILKRYLEKVPGGRPHIPVGRAAPLTDFEAVAARYPVFRITRAETTDGLTPRRRLTQLRGTFPRERRRLREPGCGLLADDRPAA